MNMAFIDFNLLVTAMKDKKGANLVYIVNIIFFGEILVCVLPFQQHLHINRTNPACENHHNSIIWKKHLEEKKELGMNKLKTDIFESKLFLNYIGIPN